MGHIRWAALALMVFMLALGGCGGGGGGPLPVTTYLNSKLIGSGSNDFAYGIAAGEDIYIAGYSEGSFDDNTHYGYADIALAKFDQQLVKKWSRQQGTAYPDIAYAAALDADGNLYAAGTTYDGLDGNINSGLFDIAIVKYDKDGTKKWSQQFGTALDEKAYGASVDKSGSSIYVYITGHTKGALDGQSSSGGSDIFLTKYDAFGGRLSTKQWGSAGEDMGRAVAVDSTGNVYVAGYTTSALPGNASSGGTDAFLTKYNSAGLQQWIRQFGTSGYDDAFGVAVDGAGNIYVVGATDGAFTGNINKGKLDYFLRKYDPSGNVLFTKELGTHADEVARAVTVDASNNVYVTGYTLGELDENVNTNAGQTDAFLVKFDPNGARQWTRQSGTAGAEEAYSVAVDSKGYIYIAGTSAGNFEGWQGKGGFDMFVLKYSSAGEKI